MSKLVSAGERRSVARRPAACHSAWPLPEPALFRAFPGCSASDCPPGRRSSPAHPGGGGARGRRAPRRTPETWKRAPRTARARSTAATSRASSNWMLGAAARAGSQRRDHHRRHRHASRPRDGDLRARRRPADGAGAGAAAGHRACAALSAPALRVRVPRCPARSGSGRRRTALRASRSDAARRPAARDRADRRLVGARRRRLRRRAAVELAEQVAPALLPEPAAIFVPIGSGGTVAGLVLGAPRRSARAVVGVLVTDILPPLAARLARTRARRRSRAAPRRRRRSRGRDHARGLRRRARAARTRLRRHHAGGEAAPRRWPTPRGLALETTYTAKCMAAMLDSRPSGGPARARAVLEHLQLGRLSPARRAGPRPPAHRLPRRSAVSPRHGWRDCVWRRCGAQEPRAAAAASRLRSRLLAGSRRALAALPLPCGARGRRRRADAGAGAFFARARPRILTQVVERMVDTGEPRAALSRHRAIATIDSLCASLDPTLTAPLPALCGSSSGGRCSSIGASRASRELDDDGAGRLARRLDDEQSRAAPAWASTRCGTSRCSATYAQEETWAGDRLRGPLAARRGGGAVIEDLADAASDLALSADVCVIGSGAGGAVAAAELARGGLDVVVLEQGRHWTSRDFTQREDEMLPRSSRTGGHAADGDGSIIDAPGPQRRRLDGPQPLLRVPHARPDPARCGATSTGSATRRARRCASFERVEQMLKVKPIREDEVNALNRMIRAGAEKLGYSGFVTKHNREGCVQSGYCILGCSYDAKQSMLVTYVPARSGGRAALRERAAERIEVERRARRVRARRGRTSSCPAGRPGASPRGGAGRGARRGRGGVAGPAAPQRPRQPAAARSASNLHLHPSVHGRGHLRRGRSTATAASRRATTSTSSSTSSAIRTAATC